MAKCVKLILILTLYSLSSCDTPAGAKSEVNIGAQLQQLIDSASKQVSDVTPSKERVKELTADEVQKLYSFEYRFLEVELKAPASQIEAKLNELGQDTWECSFVDKNEVNLRFLCKRKPKTYLRYVPRIF